MVIGGEVNVAIAARMAVYMILARLMTPGAFFFPTSRTAWGGDFAWDAPMMSCLVKDRRGGGGPKHSVLSGLRAFLIP